MLLKTIKIYLLSTLLLVLLPAAHAQETGDGGYQLIDRGQYFSDPNTSLDWIKLTETSGNSVLTINSQLALGGLYEGWRYATQQEIFTLINNNSGETFDPANFQNDGDAGFVLSAQLSGLFELIGITMGEGLRAYTAGLYYFNEQQISSIVLVYYRDQDTSFFYNGGFPDISFSDWASGHFLVRNSSIPVNFVIRTNKDGSVMINNSNQVTVTLLGSDALDVRAIDKASLMLDSAKIRLRGDKAPHCRLVDHNQDQYQDLECRFKDDAKQWLTGTAQVNLSGQLSTGKAIAGQATITFVRK